MYFRDTTAIVLSLTAALNLTAQPLPDQFVATYNENESPYPLYMGEQGPDPVWTADEIDIVARNFNACYGNPNWDSNDWNTITNLNPDFELVPYVGNWRVNNIKYIDETNPDTEYSQEDIERDFKDQFLYYRFANLASAIDDAQTTITVNDALGSVFASTAAPGATYATHNGSAWEYVTWLVVEGEFMRIENVSGNTLTVTRGWDGTTASAHASGSAVAAPVYGTDPDPSGSSRFDYRTNPNNEMRYYDILNRILMEYDNRGGGVWIDIIEGGLSRNRMDGGGLSGREWNIFDNTVQTETEESVGTNEGIDFIQNEFYARRGDYPVIWGNNVLHPTDNFSARLNLLRATTEKPRPIDGFAQENTVGGYGSGGDSGKEFNWTSNNNWLEHVESMMFMGEQQYSARPLMLDGGVDNRNFSAESDAFRNQVLLYGYATYLMAVIVEPDDRIFTQIGFTPLVGPDGAKYVYLPRFFQWDIGRPTETEAAHNLMNYQVGSTEVFRREFENGIVLANPSDSTTHTVSLDGQWFDPMTSNLITQISMEPKTGRLLFYPEMREARLYEMGLVTNSTIQTEWEVFPDLAYQLESTDHLTNGTWSPVGLPFSPTKKFQALELPAAGTSGFYRIATLIDTPVVSEFIDTFENYSIGTLLNDTGVWSTPLGNDAAIGAQSGSQVVDFSAGKNRHILNSAAYIGSGNHYAEITFRTSVNEYGLIVHYTDIDNHAFIHFSTTDDTINFTEITGGVESNSVVGTVSTDLVNQKWYTIRVEYTASNKVYDIELNERDGSPSGTATPLFSGSHTNTTFSGGQVGFGYNYAGSGYADNFEAGSL
ncbi:hypothetical protein [Pontiella desulfatans]|nr:hypothetical protein [Pontiella desulfatans]